MAHKIVHAGIDVSKAWLDLALWPSDETARFSRDAAGLKALAVWLCSQRVKRIGLEASGGYERMVMDHLIAAEFEVLLLNPLRVRRFAEASGKLAKNDRADARVIAAFTALLAETARPGRRRDLDQLLEHLRVRHQIRDWIVDCENQLEHLRDPAMRRKIQARQRAFRSDLAALDRKIAALVAAEPDLRQRAQRLRSVPGVGPVLTHTVMALLPELGHLTRREIASLAGVAPFDDDSGTRSGARHVKGGRSAVREALYMAALVAKRRNPVIAAFAKRLHGKKPKVIIVACMRKLLVMLNAMARDATEWRPPAMA